MLVPPSHHSTFCSRFALDRSNSSHRVSKSVLAEQASITPCWASVASPFANHFHFLPSFAATSNHCISNKLISSPVFNLTRFDYPLSYILVHVAQRCILAVQDLAPTRPWNSVTAAALGLSISCRLSIWQLHKHHFHLRNDTLIPITTPRTSLYSVLQSTSWQIFGDLHVCFPHLILVSGNHGLVPSFCSTTTLSAISLQQNTSTTLGQTRYTNYIKSPNFLLIINQHFSGFSREF